MKRFFLFLDQYIQSRDWKMVAALKLCLCSTVIFLGLAVPEKHKKSAGRFAIGVFLATAIPLMADFFSFAVDFFRPETKDCE